MIRGALVRQLRQQVGMTQAMLGSAIRKDGAYVSRLECERIPGMTLKTFEQLCRALRVSPDTLLTPAQ